MELHRKRITIVVAKALLFLALTSYPIFLNLHVHPIYEWDESVLATNAYEMSKDGNYLIPQFGKRPDMWNNKPPLMIWLQVAFIKIFGMGELAIRLPSALAALATALILLLFAMKYFGSYWMGLATALILVTSHGYVDVHAARTGDYDALLAFFTTGYLLAFFLFLEKEEKMYVHLFFLGVTLSVLTKSIQGLIFIPAIIIYLLVLGKPFALRRTRGVLTSFFLCIAAIAGYHLFREYYNPGYIRVVAEVTRFFTPEADHQYGFWYYLTDLLNRQYAAWYWLFPCGLVIGFFVKDDKLKRMTLFSTLMIGFYWLVISYSRTKHDWYTVPLFPFLALVSATAVFWVFGFLRGLPSINQQFRFNVIPFIFLFLLYLKPYEKIVHKVSQEYALERENYNISYFLKWAVGSQLSIPDHYVCYDGYKAHLLFYTRILNERDQRVRFKDWAQLAAGDRAIASQDCVRQYIEDNYAYQVERKYLNIRTYRILSRKDNGM